MKLTGRNIIHCITLAFLLCAAVIAPAFAQQFSKDSLAVAEALADSAYTDSAYVDDEAFHTVVFDSLTTTTADTFTQRKLDGQFVNNLKSDKDFFYVKNGIPQRPPPDVRVPMNMLSIIIWIVVGAVLIVILVWFLNKNILRRSATSLKTQAGVEEHENIFTINYNDVVQKALQAKNYRLAIRLQYLQILKLLSQKNIINYMPDKTNHDYMMQLRQTTYYDDFFALTRNYEYSWYGLFEVNEDAYKKVDKAFNKFQNRI